MEDEALAGGGTIDAFGRVVSVTQLYTPMLVLTLLLLARWWGARRPRLVIALPRPDGLVENSAGISWVALLVVAWAYEDVPGIREILDLSEGKTLGPERRRRALVEVDRQRDVLGIGWVVSNTTRMSPELLEFCKEAFALSLVDSDRDARSSRAWWERVGYLDRPLLMFQTPQGRPSGGDGFLTPQKSIGQSFSMRLFCRTDLVRRA